MGEIKSTLDLVMERTRHLSMSQEEKEVQRREAFEKRLQGLLQQYEDEGQSVDRLLERVAALQKELDAHDDRAPTAAVLHRIDPDQDNGRRLAVLERLSPQIGTPLRTILAEYRKNRSDCLQTFERDLRHRLEQHHGIAGAAVVPNPRKDAACRNELEALRHETREAIDALAGRDG